MKSFTEDQDSTCTEDTSKKLTLEQSENGESVIIQHLNPDQGYRTLGIWITADGNPQKQLKILQEIVSHWLECVTNSSLRDLDSQLAYQSFLRPQLLYLLGCATIDHNDLKKMFRLVLDELLHTLGLNKNFPLALVHAGTNSMGLGIEDLPTMQGISQLQLLLGHANKQDRTATLILIERDYLELTIGVGRCPLLEPYIATLEHVPDTWMTSICSFLHKNNSSVEIRHTRVVPVQQDQDQYIMQLALDGNYNLRLIQQCRLYLQAATLADIINADRTQLEEWA